MRDKSPDARGVAVEKFVCGVRIAKSQSRDQVGFLAKMAEIMRMMPREALSLDGPACEIDKVFLLERDGAAGGDPKADGGRGKAEEDGPGTVKR